uniref:Uncharacterized protein n=1 Tax=Anopheles melas TaxID=34690 RepID=A0A182UA59_9DIPT
MIPNPYTGSIEKPVRYQEVVVSGTTSINLRLPDRPMETFFHSHDSWKFVRYDTSLPIGLPDCSALRPVFSFALSTKISSNVLANRPKLCKTWCSSSGITDGMTCTSNVDNTYSFTSNVFDTSSSPSTSTEIFQTPSIGVGAICRSPSNTPVYSFAVDHLRITLR